MKNKAFVKWHWEFFFVGLFVIHQWLTIAIVLGQFPRHEELEYGGSKFLPHRIWQ